MYKNKIIHNMYDLGYLSILFSCAVSENTFWRNYFLSSKFIFIGFTLICFIIYAIKFNYKSYKQIIGFGAVILLGLLNYKMVGSAWILYSILLILYFPKNKSIAFCFD